MFSRFGRIASVVGFFAVVMMAVDAAGQAGDGKDRAGSVQESRVPEEVIPEAPVLSPAEALESFSLPPGFKVEIAAAEPYVNSPVAMKFDELGRMWVVEMTGYMPNPDGTGEDARVGSIVTLEDTDNDGQVDKRTVFLDELQMPRAICLYDGGVLVAEPPYLWFCQDTNGDGTSDTQEVVDDKYGSQVNPEHTSNGLMVALDNWIYSANHGVRYKKQNGEWLKEPTISRGQWGISQDNYGRIYYNSNSDQLRVDLFPTHYLNRNPGAGRLSGGSFRTTTDQTVWPARVNPGVNRAYRPNTLRDEDHTLAQYTGASGPVIYRGDNFPADFVNNGFVPEPTGNFIRRNILTDINGTVSAENAYFQSEFLTSTDERFRPVNLYNGPDGCLYVVDFYRGLIQHRIYLTTYLRKQIESRGLENPTDLGRIYRVKWTGMRQRVKPSTLDKSNNIDLVKGLSSDNGWMRDTAQRLIIESNNNGIAAQLKRLAQRSTKAPTRRHALWALEGIGELDVRTLRLALNDTDAKNRATAIRLSEPFITGSNAKGNLRDKVLAMASDPSFEPRVQLAFTLGELPAGLRVEPLNQMMLFGSQNEWMQNAALSSLRGIEADLLAQIVEDRQWNVPNQARQDFVRRVAASILNSKDSEMYLAVANKVVGLPATSKASADAIIAGLTPSLDKNKKPSVVMQLKERPVQLVQAASENDAVKNMLAALSWRKPGGDANEVKEVKAQPLTKEQQELFEKGKFVYTTLCGACHQPNGAGQEGLAPPLENSDWVSGSKGRLARIVLQGMQGPVMVDGKEYNMLMPGLAVLDDTQVASVLTYIRRSFGHTASAVSPAEVAEVREATKDRLDLWTSKELLQIK